MRLFALLLILIVLFLGLMFIGMGTGIIHTTGMSKGSGLTLLGIILTGMAIIHFLKLFLGTEVPLLTTLTTGLDYLLAIVLLIGAIKAGNIGGIVMLVALSLAFFILGELMRSGVRV